MPMFMVWITLAVLWASKVSRWAADAVQWACGAGLITGDEAGKLNPQGKATRAEAATILMRYLENIAA